MRVSLTCATGLGGTGICVLDVVICRRPARGFFGGLMFVQRVAGAGSRPESWAVIADDGAPVEPVDRYLAFLTDVERSPNTVKAYAHDLKDWFEFLGVRGVAWQGVCLDDVGEFVAWLRLPLTARQGLVVVLPTVAPACSEATVNRKRRRSTLSASTPPAPAWICRGCCLCGPRLAVVARRGGRSCTTSARAAR